jgi:hypothetical protein
MKRELLCWLALLARPVSYWSLPLVLVSAGRNRAAGRGFERAAAGAGRTCGNLDAVLLAVFVATGSSRLL